LSDLDGVDYRPQIDWNYKQSSQEKIKCQT